MGCRFQMYRCPAPTTIQNPAFMPRRSEVADAARAATSYGQGPRPAGARTTARQTICASIAFTDRGSCAMSSEMRSWTPVQNG